MSHTHWANAPDSTRIAYDVAGSGTPLVLIHGITERRDAWNDFVPPLAGAHRVVRVDLRGHGESAAGGDYSPSTLAGDVAAVVQDLDLDAPHLVGHSLGGMVATAYAAFHPVRSVVNVDQPLQFAEFAALLRSIAPELRGDGFHDAMNREMEQLAGPALTETHKSRLRAMRAHACRDVVLALWGPLMTQADAEVAAAVEALLAGVRCPYLSLQGADLGPAYTAWLTGAIPGATLETWDGVGHWLHLVEPERFVERVLAFIASTEAPQQAA